MFSKQSAPTPQRKRLSYKDKAAIIEAAKKGGVKEAVRDKMMSDYQISRSAYYAIFRNFEPKMATVQPNAKSRAGDAAVSTSRAMTTSPTVTGSLRAGKVTKLLVVDTSSGSSRWTSR